jgi:hypothetical protein
MSVPIAKGNAPLTFPSDAGPLLTSALDVLVTGPGDSWFGFEPQATESIAMSTLVGSPRGVARRNERIGAS